MKTAIGAYGEKTSNFKFMKKLLTILIFAVLCGDSAMAYDFSAVCESGQTLYYNITSDVEPYTVEVTYSSEFNGRYYYDYYVHPKPFGDLVISEIVTYNSRTYSVTSIGYSAFNGCSGLTSVTIPNSVTSIGDRAFSGCSGLTSVTIPSSVTSIKYRAFYSCSGLTSVTIPNSVTNIGGEAFYGCSGLTSVTITNSVTSIGGSAFYNCSGLTSVTIPSSVTDIGNEAFGRVRNVVYSGNATGSPWGALTINGYVDGYLVYSDDTKNNLTGCSTLASEITIHNSVTNIGDYAFSGCSGVKYITIPNSVVSIGNNAFDCVKNIVYNGTATGSPWGALTINGIVDGVLIYSDDTKTYLTGCDPLANEVTIPNTVTTIAPRAFAGCKNLTEVTIPSSITNIGAGAFQYCNGLVTVNFNATNCAAMGTHDNPAFNGCTSLTTLNIGDNVTNIPEQAFKSCIGLSSVIIPNSVTKVEYMAFYGCSGITMVTLPNSVTYIDYHAFDGCRLTEPLYNANYFVFFPSGYATEYTIPDGILHITNTAFQGCSELVSVTIPNSVTTIEPSSFWGCSSLTSVIIPNSVQEIRSYAFEECYGLTRITIPESVTRIDLNPFMYDYRLESIVVDAENSNYDSRNNCNAIIDKQNNKLITGCKNTVIPNTVTSIGNYAFRYCIDMATVRIPNSVTRIEHEAFGACRRLKTVTLGSSLEVISDYAFLRCDSVTSVYSNSLTPPRMGRFNFKNDAIIYVPCGAEDSYVSSNDWSRFTDIQGSRAYMLNLESANPQKGYAIITQSPDCTDGIAIIEAIPNSGCYFVQWNDGNTDNPRTIVVTEDITYTATFEGENGVEEISIEKKIDLYPNPVGNTLYISAEETIFEIEIVNTLGQVVKRIEVNADNAVCNVEGLANGVYVVKISTLSMSKGAEIQRKFIKE